MEPNYPLFPIFAFLGFLLPLIPLPWHFLAYNSGTCYFIFWSSLACLNLFVNSIVWKDNVTNWAPWWCEISTRLLLGASVGIPASSLCINRRLYYIADVRAVTITRADKRRAVLVDTLLCMVFPMVFIAMQYIVQGHRFNIFEQTGCYPALYNTLPLYFINCIWPIILGLISASYCVLSLRAFARRRLEFSQFLSSNTTLTVSRYFRLMALATTEIMCTTPLAIVMICVNTQTSVVSPWRSWEDTHYDFGRINQLPALIWRENHLLIVAMDLTRWVTVACSFIFFGYFGFASEARRHYRMAWGRILALCGIPVAEKKSSSSVATPAKGPYQYPKPMSSGTSSIPSLPPYSPSSATSKDKNRSIDTVSTIGSTAVELDSFTKDDDEYDSVDGRYSPPNFDLESQSESNEPQVPRAI